MQHPERGHGRRIGASHVIDYAQQDFTQAGQRYDLLADIAGGRTLAERRRVLTPKGILVAVGGPDNGQWTGPVAGLAKIVLLSAEVSQTLTPLLARQRADDLAILRELLEDGKVTPVIDRTYRSAKFPRPSATSNKDTPGERSPSPSKPIGSVEAGAMRKRVDETSPRTLARVAGIL